MGDQIGVPGKRMRGDGIEGRRDAVGIIDDGA
jgi:hypothetical protein